MSSLLSKGRFIQLSPLSRWVVIFIYGIVVIVGVINHEPWRDETHSWLIVQLTNSLSELFVNTLYEGHPSAWYLVLYGVKLAGGTFAVVQAIHVLIAVAGAYFLLTYAPFPVFVRVALLFSYFLVYEYAVIARNYAIGVFLLFVLCALFPRRHETRPYLWLCLLTASLFQTNTFALLIGAALYGVVLLEAVLWHRATLQLTWKQYGVGTVIVGTGFLISLLDMLTPADGGFPDVPHGGWTIKNAIQCVQVLWNVSVPIPATFQHFWNTNFLDALPVPDLRRVLRVGFTVGLVGLVFVPLFRSRLALAGWALSCLLILFVMFTQYFGFLRHHGHFFMALIVFLWIQPNLPDFRNNWMATPVWIRPSTVNQLCALLLIGQVVASVTAYTADLIYPFSTNKAVAAYIGSHSVRNWFKAGSQDYAIEGIATYLPDHDMYYPENGQRGGFIRWNKDRHAVSVSEVIDSVQSVSGETPALVIFNKPLSKDTVALFRLSPLTHFVGSIVNDEQYWLYASTNKTVDTPDVRVRTSHF